MKKRNQLQDPSKRFFFGGFCYIKPTPKNPFESAGYCFSHTVFISKSSLAQDDLIAPMTSLVRHLTRVWLSNGKSSSCWETTPKPPTDFKLPRAAPPIIQQGLTCPERSHYERLFLAISYSLPEQYPCQLKVRLTSVQILLAGGLRSCSFLESEAACFSAHRCKRQDAPSFHRSMTKHGGAYCDGRFHHRGLCPWTKRHSQ